MGINNHLKASFFESFKKGDEKAFTYFYELYFNAIKNFSISFIYDVEEAENIVQEAFLNLWEKRGQVESVNGIQSFLFTYAKSKCLNAIRHNKVKDRFKSQILNEKERALDLEILNSLPLDELEFKELEKVIENSIKQLPLTTQKVFIQKRFENKKNAEIAEEMNISIKTVEAHMTKALKLLKEGLSDYHFILIHFYF
ncbi:RNA polymerase sigma-70 factor [Flavobacterium sp. MAHUQ-51]|uniref:RNA polymerase sigma-70 factor n=1 Tax=Flavobacterium sp. GCM10022190 TaxID=3252639 RepID=UPI003613CDFA